MQNYHRQNVQFESRVFFRFVLLFFPFFTSDSHWKLLPTVSSRHWSFVPRAILVVSELRGFIAFFVCLFKTSMIVFPSQCLSKETNDFFLLVCASMNERMNERESSTASFFFFLLRIRGKVRAPFFSIFIYTSGTVTPGENSCVCGAVWRLFSSFWVRAAPIWLLFPSRWIASLTHDLDMASKKKKSDFFRQDIRITSFRVFFFKFERKKNREFNLKSPFFDAFSHLYKRICPSVGRSVGLSGTHKSNIWEMRFLRWIWII